MGYLTPEQVRARVPDPVAAFVGNNGVVVPLAAETTIGRDASRCEVALLDASISIVHARVERREDLWTITDLGSTNGTLVNELAAPAELHAGARVRLGAIELVFSPTQVMLPRRRRRTTLVGLPPARIAALDLSDGALDLTQREVRLLQMLIARHTEAEDADFAYVSSLEIAERLGFRSIEPDGENVRELVMRLRRKLRAAGIGDVIDNRRGAGYRYHAVR